MPQPPIIQYTNLLHQYRNPEAPAVQAFVAQHMSDAVLMKRIQTLNQVFKMNQDLVTTSRSAGSRS